MNNSTKYTVSVGIPAYNEAANIARLVRHVLDQKAVHFELHEVVVVSDGSTDNTDVEARGVLDPRVALRSDDRRLGKVARQNQLCQELVGDIIVLFDADILLADDLVLEHLVSEFRLNPQVDLVCGKHWPLEPRTFIERVAYFGAQYWETAKDLIGNRADMYNCLGQVRAFSRRFARELRVPEAAGSFEDTYSFLYAKQHGKEVVVNKKAKVLFRLSSTLRDYVYQMTRYIRVPRTAHDFFPASEIAKYDHMTGAVRLRAFWATAFRLGWVLAVWYILFQSLTIVYGFIARPRAMWAISPSSKNV